MRHLHVVRSVKLLGGHSAQAEEQDPRSEEQHLHERNAKRSSDLAGVVCGAVGGGKRELLG